MLAGGDNLDYNIDSHNKTPEYQRELNVSSSEPETQPETSQSRERLFFEEVLKAAASQTEQHLLPKKPKFKHKSQQSSTYREPLNGTHHEFQRPLLSYNELIIESLRNSKTGMLSLQQIYDYIQNTYLFFKHSNVAWQNSIRHNLSVQKMFERVPRPVDNPGKGGLWRIVPWALDPNTAKGNARAKKRKHEHDTCVNSPYQDPESSGESNNGQQEPAKRNHLMDTLATLALSADSQDFEWPTKESQQWQDNGSAFLSGSFAFQGKKVTEEPIEEVPILDPMLGEQTLMQATNVDGSSAEVIM